MKSFARGSPFRSPPMLVSVLALLVLAKVGPSNAVPPDEVAVSTDPVPRPAPLESDVVQVMPTIAAPEFSVLHEVTVASSPALPAPRVLGLDVVPSADSITPVAWRSPVSPTTAAPERNDARPPNRQRT